MTVNPSNSNKLKDLDFDNIFEDQNTSKKDEVQDPPIFDSFGHTETSTIRNSQTLNNNNVNFKHQKHKYSFPGSSINLDYNKNRDNMPRTSLQANSTRLNKEFDGFTFTKKEDVDDVFDFNNNNSRIKHVRNNNKDIVDDNTDIDLMGMDLDDGIINKDIHALDQNLFQKAPKPNSNKPNQMVIFKNKN